MKKIVSLLVLIFILIGCMPVRKVDVGSRHNYYERHRYNTYTSPTWIPNQGIILETHIYRLPIRSYRPISLRHRR